MRGKSDLVMHLARFWDSYSLANELMQFCEEANEFQHTDYRNRQLHKYYANEMYDSFEHLIKTIDRKVKDEEELDEETVYWLNSAFRESIDYLKYFPKKRKPLLEWAIETTKPYLVDTSEYKRLDAIYNLRHSKFFK